MDAAGHMGRGTRQARRMCGLKRRALVSFACVALFVFLALSSLATREDRTGDARLMRAPRLREHRGDGGTVEGDAWLAEWQRAHGVDARGAHGARAEMLDVREPMSSSSRTPPKAHHVVAAGKHHNKRYSLRGSLEASLDSDDVSASEEDTDPALSAALRSMRLPPGSLVALTFADAKMLAMVLNWSAHLRRANVPRLVGALDDHTAQALEARNVPTFRVRMKHSGSLDGGSAHASDSWKSFAATRIAKVRATLELGYDVLMSDADVVWRADPTHYLQCPEMAVEAERASAQLPCASIAAADVMVSSDNLSPKTDAKRGALYARGGVFNTGVVFLKTTPGAKAFAKAWSRLLTLAADGAVFQNENDARFARLTSDQQVFNAMTRRENEWPGLDPVDHHTEVPGDVSAPSRVLEAGLGLPVDDASANVDGFRAFKLGVLPVAAFQPGHVAFLQRVDEMSEADLAHVFGEATTARPATNDERRKKKNEKRAVLRARHVHVRREHGGGEAVPIRGTRAVGPGIGRRLGIGSRDSRRFGKEISDVRPRERAGDGFRRAVRDARVVGAERRDALARGNRADSRAERRHRGGARFEPHSGGSRAVLLLRQGVGRPRQHLHLQLPLPGQRRLRTRAGRVSAGPLRVPLRDAKRGRRLRGARRAAVFS